MLGEILYKLFLFLYPLGAKLIAFKNKKARLWLEGRKNSFLHLSTKLNNNQKTIWMHCSSLGEFEQGKPVFERLKKAYPSHQFLITFFSPSGYEVCKNYAAANCIAYLPMDSLQHARTFFNIVNPSLILFVKYEFWHYYLQEAKQRKIPLLLISGIFRKSQPFFKWHGAFHRKMLQCFTHFFLQNQSSVELLNSIGYKENITTSGDTRFDRVLEIANKKKSIPLIEKFIGNCAVIVAGSTWLEDDEELDHFANTRTDIKFIIAPHEIEPDRIAECRKLYKHSILWSEIADENMHIAIDPQKNVLIIDNIGMLSTLYRYATICMVGGAFGDDGVHNVLEAAVYAKPVIFGPVYDKYAEAVDLIETGGATSVENALELEDELNKLLSNENLLHKMGEKAGNYVASNAGASKQIIDYCIKNLQLK